MSLGLSQFSALESLRIPVFPLVTTFLPHVTSPRLTNVTLDLIREYDWHAARADGSPWEDIEKHFCPLAKRFKGAHPGEEMRVVIVGYFKNRWTERESIRRTYDDERFIPNLKNEAKVRMNFM